MPPKTPLPLAFTQAMERLLSCRCPVQADTSLPEEDMGAAGGSADVPYGKMLPDRWERIYFSNAGEGLLRRYFSQQFRVLVEALALLPVDGPGSAAKARAHAEVMMLIRLLLTGYVHLLQPELTFPAPVLDHWIVACRPEFNGIRKALLSLGRQHALSSVLGQYLDALDGARAEAVFSISEFVYAEMLLAALVQGIARRGAEPLDLDIEEVLMRHNFNHFGFLSYRRRKYRAQLDQAPALQQTEIIQQAQEQLLNYHSVCTEAYDERWPCVREHLQGWLAQQLLRVQMPVVPEKPSPPKIRMELSVAHLACIIRAFYEAGLFRGESLAGVFRAIAGCISTKQQPDISVTSLKKEYYSVSQFTAARVMELLQQMILQLRGHYFPVLAAVSATLAFAPGNPLILPAIGG